MMYSGSKNHLVKELGITKVVFPSYNNYNFSHAKQHDLLLAVSQKSVSL